MAEPIPIDGKVLRDLRRLRCLSQVDLGREAGVDRKQISRYECGAQGPPPDHLQWIIAALERIPVSLEQRALIKTPDLDAALERIENLMHRRQLARLAGATGGLLALAGVPIDSGEMSLHQAAQELIERWATTTPAESLAAARELLNRQSQALKTAAMNGSERRQLLVDAVETAILAGWSAHCVDLPAEQAAWFAHAQHLAGEVGLDTIRGEVLASQASMHRPLVGDGNSLLGLELARAAEPLVGGRGPLAKYVVYLQSFMLTPTDEDESLRELDRALRLPEGPGRGFYSEPGIFSNWSGEQQRWAGDIYARLGRPDDASAHFDEAMATGFTSPRTPILDEASMALAHAIAGNPEPMCHHAHVTLDGSRATGYEKGVTRVRHARATLEGCDGVGCVRELDARLATL